MKDKQLNYCSNWGKISNAAKKIKNFTNTNLAVLAQYANNTVDNIWQVDVIYTNFQKAFGKIDHFILLRKLNSLRL